MAALRLGVAVNLPDRSEEMTPLLVDNVGLEVMQGTGRVRTIAHLYAVPARFLADCAGWIPSRADGLLRFSSDPLRSERAEALIKTGPELEN